MSALVSTNTVRWTGKCQVCTAINYECLRHAETMSPRYMGAAIWGESVVEEPLFTLIFFSFPKQDAKRTLTGHNNVDSDPPGCIGTH